MNTIPSKRSEWNDNDFFELLDQTVPGVDTVVDAWRKDKSDTSSARKVLVDYLASRTQPMWIFDGRDGTPLPAEIIWPLRPYVSEEQVLLQAEKALVGRLVLGPGLEIDLGSKFRWRTPATTNLGVPGNGFRTGGTFFLFAYAYQLTGESRYAQGLRRFIEHWIVDWPFEVEKPFDPQSIIFSRVSGFKSLPTGVRLFNWISCLYTKALYSSYLSPETVFKLVKELCFTGLQYLRFEEAEYRHGNHHIMRCGTVPALLAIMFPEIRPFKRFFALAESTFRDHIERSILADSGYEERSVAYSSISLQMILAPLLLAKKNSISLVSSNQLQRLCESAMTVAAMIQPDGMLPPLGDGLSSRSQSRQFLSTAHQLCETDFF